MMSNRAFRKVALGVLVAAGLVAAVPITAPITSSASTSISTCSYNDLRIAEDSASGAYSALGNQGVAFMIVNVSHAACSLKGYPRLRLFPTSYKGKANTVTDNGGSQIFANVRPREIVIKPASTASFGLNFGDAYNQGDPNNGACDTESVTTSLPVKPHPYSAPYTNSLRVNFCFANFKFGVTSIQNGPLPKTY